MISGTSGRHGVLSNLLGAPHEVHRTSNNLSTSISLPLHQYVASIEKEFAAASRVPTMSREAGRSAA
eukprot:scaffold212_cov404-Prasinococcus_capsulatus_cf.AAC.17